MTEQDSHDPDWGTDLSLTVTPNGISHALFWTASAVHTGWSSCIDKSMVIAHFEFSGGNRGQHGIGNRGLGGQQRSRATEDA